MNARDESSDGVDLQVTDDADREVCGATRETITVGVDGVEVTLRQVCQQTPGHYDPPSNPHGYYVAWTEEEDDRD